MKAGLIALVAANLVTSFACTKPPQTASGPSPETAEARLSQIPAADPQKYSRLRDMKGWHNPYLLLKPDGFWLLDVNNNEERPLKPDQVLSALAALPDSAWPYGRVVAVQEIVGGNSDADHISLRKNRAILAGTLGGAKVLISWVPTS
ncbi:MAG: hypothetical protein JOZ80_04960 [Acidobacteriaceae bacterium]|nr:hypothetical protein [Acidobacteriaceae bacterium]